MHTQKILMLIINVIGGIAVLGSYAYGMQTHPGSGNALWGGISERIRPLYAVGMLLAALGYFAFTYYLLFRLDPDSVVIAGRCKYSLFNYIYLGILIPSALWMPFTFKMIENPATATWVIIRVILAIVALASLALIWAIAAAAPRGPATAYWLALLGSSLFFLHTAVLDAILWPAYFRV